VFTFAFDRNPGRSSGETQRRLQRIRQPRLDRIACDQAVDDGLDCVLGFFVQLRDIVEIVD